MKRMHATLYLIHSLIGSSSGVVVLFFSVLLLLFCFAFCCLFRRGLMSGWQENDPSGIKY